MPRSFSNLLVTGGAGFMGSDFIRYVLRETSFSGKILNLDKLTYAGDPENLADLSDQEHAGRYRLEVCDIRDRERLARIFRDEEIDGVVHFAAESHVDRSIAAADAFAATNVLGTLSLIEAAREAWSGRPNVHFHHITTDEVFGSCLEGREFRESDPYQPSSPYAASKAGADHLVRAFGHTHGFPYTVTHACNNYGPRQTPEKLIPLVVTRLCTEQTIPVYGRGDNVREWMFVTDHSRAVWDVVTRGAVGRSYNVGTGERVSNLDLIRSLGREVARQTGRAPDYFESLITFVADRPGHDRRYALDSSRIRADLGWRTAHSLADGLAQTVEWYVENEEWIERARERLESWLAQEGDVWAKRVSP